MEGEKTCKSQRVTSKIYVVSSNIQAIDQRKLLITNIPLSNARSSSSYLKISMSSTYKNPLKENNFLGLVFEIRSKTVLKSNYINLAFLWRRNGIWKMFNRQYEHMVRNKWSFSKSTIAMLSYAGN